MKGKNKKEDFIGKFQEWLTKERMFFLSGFLVFFILGFLFGDSDSLRTWNEEDDLPNQEIHQSGYRFISPLLECGNKENFSMLKPDELEIKKRIQNEIIDKNPDIQVSLYYRDLKNGPWFGINEQTSFSPASLLKVPLMIAYYKYAEKYPDILSKKITFSSATPVFQQNVVPYKHIQIGQTYAVEELIEFMIKYSDNEATNLLYQNISQQDLEVIFKDLGVTMPDIYDPNNSISAKDYAAFFRILYNASYLNRDMSERALELLSGSEYANGVLAGIPNGVVVSHKFGERESEDEVGRPVNQLHDCGIVYHPTRPYFLCVMTKGKDFSKLSQIISGISKIFYEKIDSASR